MADFKFFLNRQGVRGNKGEQGEQGYSPRITVKTETAAEYVLNVQNEDGSFDTPNLRGNAIENLGGTYVRYNQTTEQMYTGYADTASTTSQGEVTLSTYEDLTSGGDENEVTTSKDVHDFVEAKISEASVNYVDIDDYTQKMGELDSEISDLDDNKLDFTGLTNTLAAGTNITITPNTQTGKITIAGEPVSQAQADWNQTDINAPDYIKNKPVIDDELSSTSTNAVQNRLVTNTINLISNEFKNYATNKLDNLSTEGEARLHALKAYSDNGEILTDAKGLSCIKSYAHSTFDRSKFTVVGSPVITEDGIASGFSSSNYLTFPNLNLESADKWEIEGIVNVVSNASNSDGTWLSPRTGNGLMLPCAYSSTGGNIQYQLYLSSTGSSWDIAEDQSISFPSGHTVKCNLKFTGTQYIYTCTDLDTNVVKNKIINSTAKVYQSPTQIGLKRNISGLTGSIDLKQFSITVDGVEVFSGNKTGIDNYTINGNTITIPYTESITGSKIAPASSRQDIATVATALGSANYYTLDEDNGNFTLPQVELYGLIEKAASTVPSGVVQSSTIRNIVSLTQAEYDALTTKDSNTFYVITSST